MWNTGATLLIFAAFSGCHGMMYPWHASCKIDWTFGVGCDVVNQKIFQQFNTWMGSQGCNGGGEKCLYQVTFRDEKSIEGTHETPAKHYVDDLTFTFNSPKTGTSCQVHGESRSETWYAVLDYGTNYCNLHNLIVGAGLDKMAGYKETTEDSVCTQYSSADCDKY